MKENNDIKENNEPKKDNKTLVLAAIIIIIVVAFAVFFYFLKADKETSEQYMRGDINIIYNYYKFSKLEDNKWYIDLSIRKKPYIVPFYYTPFEVEDIYIDNNTLATFGNYLKENPGGLLYISVNPNETSKIVISGVEIARLLGTKYEIFKFDVRSAVHYKPYANFTDYPVATCTEALPKRMIIVLNITGRNEIITKGNCIMLNSVDANESVRVADYFSYRLLGIITEKSLSRTNR
ncbi:MAG: hypothetical protein ACP5NV_03225 [Candidatus Woesearchaeota archaeon]